MKSSAETLFFLCLNDRGGAELSMLRLAQGLLDLGRPVVLAVYGAAPELAKECGFKGEIINLNVLRTFSAFLPLLQLVRTGRFSTVVSALTHTNLVAVFASLFAVKPMNVVVTEHGVDGVKTCRSSHFFHILTRLVYAQASCVVSVSQGLAQQWRALLSPRTFVQTIYNPIVETTVIGTEILPHPWLQNKEKPIVMGVGRLKAEKNFSLLIQAFARMAPNSQTRLMILGEGPQRAMLEALVQALGIGDKVSMPGFVSHPNAWIQAADILVCSSQQEGFGNVIVEALACGIPVVSTDCPYGPAEILQNGIYGRLVPVKDVDAMARAIQETLCAKANAEQLRARAQDFTVSNCINQYVQLIDNPNSGQRAA